MLKIEKFTNMIFSFCEVQRYIRKIKFEIVFLRHPVCKFNTWTESFPLVLLILSLRYFACVLP